VGQVLPLSAQLVVATESITTTALQTATAALVVEQLNKVEAEIPATAFQVKETMAVKARQI
jgi:hypothetical protein